MRYAFFGPNGRIESAHNDDTVNALPSGAVELTVDQWDIRFDLELIGNAVVVNPVSQPAPTREQITRSYAQAVQAHLDAAAVTAGYDNINTAVSYADEPVVSRFQVEGAAFRAWRSLCWAYCYAQLDAVEANTRTQPTIDELINELPALVMP